MALPERLDFFISLAHNADDLEFGGRLYEALATAGARVYMEQRDGGPGALAQSLDRALERSRFVLVVATRAAIESKWVAAERSGTNVVPLLRDRPADELPPTLRAFKCVDFRKEADFGAGVEQLLRFAGVGQGSEPRRPSRQQRVKGVGVAASVVAAAIVVVAAWFTWGAMTSQANHGLWKVEVEFVGEVPDYFLRGQDLNLRVRCDHDGFLWVFSPEGDLPRRVFPCPNSASDADVILASGRHVVTGGAWRYVPNATDAFGLQAMQSAGTDEMILIVTRNNSAGEALSRLKQIRPELTVRADAVRIGEWGVKILQFEVGDR